MKETDRTVKETGQKETGRIIIITERTMMERQERSILFDKDCSLGCLVGSEMCIRDSFC